MASVLLSALIKKGVITDDQATEIERLAETKGTTPLETLLAQKTVPEYEIFSTIADELGMPFVDLESLQIDVGSAGLITVDWARRLRAMPIASDHNKLVVAFDRPSNK